MITDCGTVGLGVAIPGADSLMLLVDADFSAQMAALLQLQASISITPPSLSLAAQLDMALQIVANLQAAIEIGITPPSISIQLQLIGDLIVALQLKLNILLALKALLLTAGIRVLRYDGQEGQFGPELGTSLGTGTADAHAIVMMATDEASWGAMQGFLKVSA